MSGTGYRRFRRPEWAYAVVLLAPALALFLAFVIAPMVIGFVISLTDYDILAGTASFIGAKNYLDLLGDPDFRAALWNTVVLCLEVVPVTILVSFGFAAMLDQRLHARRLLRTAYFLPLVSSAVVIATIFRFVFYQYGPVNSLLGTQTPFLSLPQYALGAIAVTLIWSLIPLNIVFYLAALQGVSQELHDAASIDGAGAIRRSRYISWPLVLPTTILVLILDLAAAAISSFDMIQVLTKGGPNGATTTAVYLLYRRAFVDFDLASASAIGFIVAAVLIVTTRLALSFQARRA
jgi:ABC-type sugar transport system permease subunit